jgi:hypothetical protein
MRLAGWREKYPDVPVFADLHLGNHDSAGSVGENVLAGVNADTASEHYWDVGLIRSNLVASPSRRFP